MKKQLILLKQNDDYILSEKENENHFIVIKNKIIKGEDVYNAFYKHINSQIEYLIESNLSDPKDKIICTQLINLFGKIDEAVNANCFDSKENEDDIDG